ncbi:MAG: ribonuclease catalytic domain-containing protein [Chromatiales bacterium]|jgi:exoribonuclease-2
MPPASIQIGSLVLYKIRPAIVTDVGEKITIQLEGDKAKRVRDKDIALLHPGPVRHLRDLESREAEIAETWELLEGETSSLPELSELLYESYTPETAWSAWQYVSEGLYFEGTPEQIIRRSAEQVETDLNQLREKQLQEEQEQQFYANIQSASLTEDDRKRLAEVEQLALGMTEKSNILRQLDIKQTMASAHQFLIKCGYWDAEHNPYPQRIGIRLDQPQLHVGELPHEVRQDLTDMPAYAIDDAGSNDPDDAISFADGRIWVHVSDVAALVATDTELDLEARARAANLYLPDRLVHMLPQPVTEQLGLGLQEESPALTISFRLDEQAQLQDIRITPSTIRATRMTYEDANVDLPDSLVPLQQACEQFRQKRLANNAAEIDLPEVSVRVVDGQVVIKPLNRIDSRQMVSEAMLMAGHAVAKFCQQNDIAIPYAGQPQPDELRNPQSPAQMYAYRRLFKASKSSLQPEPHFGLGLEPYCRATSPMRRYLDLVTHQQVRRFISDAPVLSVDELAQQISGVDQAAAAIRRAERFSNLHWKLVYFRQNPDWQGKAVVVEQDERKTTIIIPELAFETKIRSRDDVALDDTIRLKIKHIDLPEQTAHFQRLD